MLGTVPPMTNNDTWREHVTAWRVSGMTATQYCADKGLNVSSLYQWSSRLRRDDVDHDVEDAEDAEDELSPRTPRLVRVVREAPTRAAFVAAPIELIVGGVRVCIGEGFDPHVLNAVVDTLAKREAR
jgi:hypothetical protein